MKAILAIDQRNGIGINTDSENKLQVYDKEDLKHFQEITKDKFIVCGYKTLAQILPLHYNKGRKVILYNPKINNTYDTENPHYIKGVKNFTKEEILELSKMFEIVIVGGARTYEEFSECTSEVFLSVFKKSNPNCNVFLNPNEVYKNFKKELYSSSETFDVFKLTRN